jgi:hypothetical protein
LKKGALPIEKIHRKAAETFVKVERNSASMSEKVGRKSSETRREIHATERATAQKVLVDRFEREQEVRKKSDKATCSPATLRDLRSGNVMSIAAKPCVNLAASSKLEQPRRLVAGQGRAQPGASAPLTRRRVHTIGHGRKHGGFVLTAMKTKRHYARTWCNAVCRHNGPE